MTPAHDKIKRQLTALWKDLERLPGEIEGAEHEVADARHRLRELSRRIADRENEIRLEVQADPELKNETQRKARFEERCAADAPLRTLRAGQEADTTALDHMQIKVDRLRRDFRAAEYKVQIITEGVLRQETMESVQRAAPPAERPNPHEQGAA